MKKTILFAPSYPETIRSAPYQDVEYNLREAGYNARLVQIDWRRGKGRTAKGAADQLQQVYDEYPDTSEVILGGFAVGAVAAMHVAARQPNHRQPAGLVLASLAPLFREDLASARLNATLGEAGYSAAQLASYRRFSFTDLAREIDCNTQLFVGYDEDPATASRSEDAEGLLQNAQFTCAEAPEAPPTHPLYYGATMQAHLSTIEF